jgi:hypothetical protein
MRALIVRGILIGAAALAGPAVAADLDLSKCTFPQAPAVPDGSTASEQDMASASSAVRSYISESEKGLACLEAAKQGLGEEPMTEEQQAQFNGTWDGAVAAMEEVANAFNQEVREYKAKNPG